MAKTDVSSPPKPADSRISRGARRKLLTRQRLLDAAFSLMADKGAAGVTIREITDTADVGFGSFYNHFESKEALHAAVIEQQFAAHADELDELLENVDDSAEVVAVSVRHTLHRAQRDPVWGKFLAREGLSDASITHGLGQRLLRDIRRGVESRRFTVVDPLTSFLFCGGGVLAAVAIAKLPAGLEQRPERWTAPQAQLPERAAAAVLRILGIPPAEAEAIATLPLPGK